MELDFLDKYCWYHIFRPFIANLHSFKGLRSKKTPLFKTLNSEIVLTVFKTHDPENHTLFRGS